MSPAASVYYHTHWDREWYLPFRAYQIRLAEVVDRILERLEAGTLPCFMLDGQTAVLEDYLELRPENRERLARFIRDGRLRIGPWKVMPDEFLVGGESLIRNLMAGIREARAWGCEQFTGYLPDTFGHSADMPAILKKCGLESAIVWRGVHPEKALFRWQSPNGDTVTALHLTEGYSQTMLQDWTISQAEQLAALDTLMQKLEKAATPEAPFLLPMGGDHLAPLSEEGRSLLLAHRPELTETTPERYMATVNLPADMEIRTGELTEQAGSFLLSGVYSARLYLKQANRRLEHVLTRRLEPLLAMTKLALPVASGFRYPLHELALAWRLLLLNHPHDSICGCSVDEVHRENEQRFDQIRQICETLEHRAVAALQHHYPAEDCWMIFNTGDRPYTGVVPVWEDKRSSSAEADKAETCAPSGLPFAGVETRVLQDDYLYDVERIPLAHLTQQRRNGWIWATDIPPFGFRLVPKAETRRPPAETVQASENGLENSRLNVKVQPDGTLSVTDKRTGRRYDGLMRFLRRPDQGDSYNGAPVPGTIERAFQPVLRPVPSGDGTLCGQIRLAYALEPDAASDATSDNDAALNLEVTLTLLAGSPLLTLEVRFINRCREGYRLQVDFPTGSPVREVAAESHLSVVNRSYDPAYRMEACMPVAPWKELNAQTGPIQRFVSANGHSIITEGLTEYAVDGNSLRMTLLRTFQALSSADTGVRGAQAGPPLATPEGACPDRPIDCRLAWLPTPDNPSDLHDLSARFYGNVWGLSARSPKEAPPATSSPSGGSPMASLISWDSSAVIAMASYYIPGKGLLLRLVNTEDRPVTTRFQVGFPDACVEETDFLEAPQNRLAEPVATLGPKDVKTLLFQTES